HLRLEVGDQVAIVCRNLGRIAHLASQFRSAFKKADAVSLFRQNASCMHSCRTTADNHDVSGLRRRMNTMLAFEGCMRIGSAAGRDIGFQQISAMMTSYAGQNLINPAFRELFQVMWIGMKCSS